MTSEELARIKAAVQSGRFNKSDVDDLLSAVNDALRYREVVALAGSLASELYNRFRSRLPEEQAKDCNRLAEMARAALAPTKEPVGEPKFGEPWRIEGDGYIFDAAGICVYENLGGDWMDESRKRRSVACVNALAGVENPEALPALLTRLGDTVENHQLHQAADPRLRGRPCVCGICRGYRALFEMKEEPNAHS